MIISMEHLGLWWNWPEVREGDEAHQETDDGDDAAKECDGHQGKLVLIRQLYKERARAIKQHHTSTTV